MDNVFSRAAEIKQFPTTMNNTHESCFRAYQALLFVRDLLKRGEPYVAEKFIDFIFTKDEEKSDNGEKNNERAERRRK